MTVREFVDFVKNRPELLERRLAHCSDSGEGDYGVTHVYVSAIGDVVCSGGGFAVDALEIVREPDVPVIQIHLGTGKETR